MPVDQVAVFASIPSHNEVGDGSRWGDNLLFQHPTPTKKSNKTLKWTRISFAFSWGVGDRNNFPLPYPNEKPNEMLVHHLDSAAPSCIWDLFQMCL